MNCKGIILYTKGNLACLYTGGKSRHHLILGPGIYLLFFRNLRSPLRIRLLRLGQRLFIGHTIMRQSVGNNAPSQRMPGHTNSPGIHKIQISRCKLYQRNHTRVSPSKLVIGFRAAAGESMHIGIKGNNRNPPPGKFNSRNIHLLLTGIGSRCGNHQGNLIFGTGFLRPVHVTGQIFSTAGRYFKGIYLCLIEICL